MEFEFGLTKGEFLLHLEKGEYDFKVQYHGRGKVLVATRRDPSSLDTRQLKPSKGSPAPSLSSDDEDVLPPPTFPPLPPQTRMPSLEPLRFPPPLFVPPSPLRAWREKTYFSRINLEDYKRRRSMEDY